MIKSIHGSTFNFDGPVDIEITTKDAQTLCISVTQGAKQLIYIPISTLLMYDLLQANWYKSKNWAALTEAITRRATTPMLKEPSNVHESD